MNNALPPMHPGELLAEDLIPATGLTKTAIAERLRISRQSLYDILSGRQPVTANIALRLGRLFGNSPSFWLNLQAAYDVAVLGAEMAGELDRIEPVQAAE
ncbi:HigA family addiction module antitoxin [Zavarzinia compransoris]|uniref:Addiction module antidote protein, HigA family n=1 Tax=Zavarzinia compransoris TaxID=1264899 RepID=A0A317E0H6_9PROT|nr:HigA family addiction module antitoxin [Zavarzinia compransoris]PWR19600.1 addiction module antidote protein, HigA family [Zavarzinia compransoris]TDP40416.1 addiction module HigA family antidote [Zavarzinia compransoris]